MWHNSTDHHRQQSPPGAYNHQRNTTSDQMSVSSGTTGVASQPGRPQHQNYHPNASAGAHAVQRVEPVQNYYTPATYFYPSSHIHNQPHPLSQNPPTPYMPATLTSPPPGAPFQPPPSLTSTLLASSPHQLSLATQHPFLRIAGQGHLPKHTLSRWLSQDRLYAQSYIGFIGSLIARVDLPYVNITDKSTSLRWRLVDCLTRALQNIHTELAFFGSTAQKYGLDLEAPPPRRDGVFTAEPATKQYIDLFRAFWTDPSMSLLEGMVVLWATETVYLRAWGYAASFGTTTSAQKQGLDDRDGDRERDRKSKAFSDGVMSELEGSEVNTMLSGTTGVVNEDQIPNQNHNQIQSDDTRNQNRNNNTPTHSADLDGGALRDAFIPNWTSKEFEAFVAEIAELTDLLAEREDAVNRKLDVYKAVWRHVLDVERRFWPDVGVSD
ncbi:hypothetical protein PV04_00276 [Phialophora macrospora]|uniref:Thiaminase-2/PQQC domain-containing protein n=1 Tax=Phialophora macrospora TaxID=1851006 RepID=A0A0D2FUJ4_9EURO|nr:hypothetical protein PV04_00276 [Phialophora macrospora]